MNLSEVQDRVKNQFGDTSGAVITNDDIARWASDAQVDIARKTKCNETETTIAAHPAGDRDLAIGNLLSVFEVRWNGTSLRHYTRQQINMMYPNWRTATYATGTPHAYYADETGINLFPAPSEAGEVFVRYNARPSPVVNSGDLFSIPEEYHEDIVVRCLQRAYEQDGQWTAADRKGQEYTARVGETAYDSKQKDDDSYPAIRALPGDYGDAW